MTSFDFILVIIGSTIVFFIPAFLMVGIQSVIYSFVMEYLVNPILKSMCGNSYKCFTWDVVCFSAYEWCGDIRWRGGRVDSRYSVESVVFEYFR